ncbi:cytochrome ubiquinol oxidase subunit I, partial [Bacillus subtilis]|uniref:cytochrome ubiquinol oxidase subunit I n=1 Tax=Bacillus subtilis TaxID=1423 RepID=UPI0025757383
MNFPVSVLTPILQQFQFPLNSSRYSPFLRDLFPPPLPIQALFPFFIQSIFIPLSIFPSHPLPNKIHPLSISLLSFATIISSFSILTPNSFIHDPVAFTIKNAPAQIN